VDAASLKRTAGLRFFAGIVAPGLMLFLSAGTIAYWEAWTYLALLSGLIAWVVSRLLKYDPALLERRLRTKEKVPAQRRIIRLSLVVFLATIVVPGLDRRFSWSSVPVAVVLAADALIALAYLLFYRVLRENPFASRTVEVEKGQHVVMTGPYEVVRHPMYTAGVVIFLMTPLALGSYWGLLAGALVPCVLVARILGEERILLAELDGYLAYTERTPYRLIPGIW